MKKKWIIFIVVLVVVISVIFYYYNFLMSNGRASGCPGARDNTVMAFYSLNPSSECIRVDISFTCAPGGNIYLDIVNSCSNRTLIYESFNGIIQKINYSFSDLNISQEINDEWTKELYFEDNPNEIFVISAKNYPVEEYWKIHMKNKDICKEQGVDLTSEELYNCIKASEMLV